MTEGNMFKNVLNLMKLQNKQALMLVTLVESLAFEKLKKARAPRVPTVADTENGLIEYIPWDFIPNVDDYGVGSSKLRRINRAKSKFRMLKGHFQAIHDLLENVVVRA